MGEASRPVEERNSKMALQKDEIRRKIDEGWESAQPGHLYDGEEVMAQLEKELAARETSSQSLSRP